VVTSMLREIRRKTTDRVVLVSNFTRALDILQQLCVEQGHSFVRLDGSTDSAKRTEIVSQFNVCESGQSTLS